MPKHNKPKFKTNDEVVYHEGNWKFFVDKVLFDEDGKVWYFLNCNDESCEHCNPDEEYVCTSLKAEEELIDYDEWCEHTEEDECEICCN